MTTKNTKKKAGGKSYGKTKVKGKAVKKAKKGKF